MRAGNFTSSCIYKLMGNPKTGDWSAPALTYIEEKRMELRLGRQLQGETGGRETSWGKMVERRAFELLSLDYRLISQDRIIHPEIEHWTGAPDLETDTTAAEIKAPFTLKSFCQMVDCDGDWEALKKVKPEYVWQLVSNAILTGKDSAELIVYCPYESELPEIREMVSNYDGDQNKVAWINWANDNELPYLLDGGYYKNLNIFSFEIPQKDKDALTERVQKAIHLLKQNNVKNDLRVAVSN